MVRSSHRPLELLETMLFRHGEGIRHLDLHLARLARSSSSLGVPFDPAGIREALDTAVLPLTQARVQLRVDQLGSARVRTGPPPVDPVAPVGVVVDRTTTAYEPTWSRHKTNNRTAYDQARLRHPLADDVVLVNQFGMVTETSVANLAVLISGRWWTPSLDSGCLPGIGRQVAIQSGFLAERPIAVRELEDSSAIAIISSLRGWRDAVVMRDPGPYP